MLTSALLIAALAQTPQHRLFLQPNLPRVSYAFFEFAPTSGAGMGTACACTTPTGAKGEAMTFTRAGGATCAKQGLATTGIANGDLVVCTADQPRVESSGGVLGLRVEGARTSVLLRTQELDNAAWTWENGGGASATARTNDFAVAPDGTTTAERLQIPATSGVQFSDVYQAFTATGAAVPQTCSVFVRGNGAGGTTDICTYDGSSWVCSDCVFASGSWSRCSRSFATGSASSRFCKFGNNSNQNGGVARSAADIFAWGFMAEEGAYATSYIPTVAAAVTRNEDIPVFSVTRQVATGSIAMSVDPMSTIGAAAYWAATDTNGRIPYGASNVVILFDGTTTPNVAPSPAYAPGTISRLGGYWGGASMTVFAGSASTTDVFDGTMGAAGATLTLGGSAAGGIPFAGIYSRICYDPSPSRCR